MLRMIQSSSADGAKSYYDVPDYYVEGQDLPGLWGGRAAHSFGLKGEVSREAFHQLCDNINPATGKRLTSRAKERVGMDFNFHCPKILSAVQALTQDPRIVDALQASVRETMVELEKDAACPVSGKGPFVFRPTGNMVWAEFTHFTSRPVDGVPDPHLHMHCFAFNATWDHKKEMWKSAEFGGIKADARYFEAAFHARLAGRMAKMGYPIQRDGKGFWDIAGIPESVKEKYSRRTAEIEELAKELNIVDPKKLDQLGATSRQAKDKGKSQQELQDTWEGWLTDEELAAIHKANSDADGTSRAPQFTTADAIEYAADHLFERRSTVKNRKFAETALRRGYGSVGVSDVWRRMDGLIETEALIRGKKDGEVKISTREVLAEEREMLAFAENGRGMCGALGRHDYKFGDPLFSDPTKDTDEQKRAIMQVLRSHDRVIDIRGGAGTGKTTMMREVVRGLGEVVRGIREGGHDVYAFAPTADASRGVLRSEGFESADTVARLLMDQRLQQKVRGQVLWIDEAGLLGAKTLNAVFKVANAQGCRVILTGDTKQHAAVERGDAVRVLEKYGGVEPIEITKIQRQRVHKGPEPESIKQYRKAVRQLSQSDSVGGFETLDRMGAVVEFDHDADPRKRYQQIAHDYLEARSSRNHKGKPNTVLAVSPTHAEGNAVTEQIREGMKQAGRLGKRERDFVRLVNLNWTEAERTDVAKYRTGQVIQFHQNVKGGIKRGERFTVVETGADGVRVSSADGAIRTLPLDAAGRFSVYREQALQFGKGDRVRITQNGYTSDGKHRLNNGALYDVAGFTRKGDIRLNNGWIVDGRYGHITHGYVTTSHASQGKTVDVVLVAQGAESIGASSLEQFYVSVSRGKEQVRVYTNDKDGLRGAIARSSNRMSAIELVDGNGSENQETQGKGSSQKQGRRHQERQFKDRLRNRQARQMKQKRQRKFRTVMDRTTQSRGKHHEQGIYGR